MAASYDIVLFSDFRFPGGTGSAIAEEIKANAAAGYRTGLVHLEAANLSYPFPVNPKIRALIDAGLVEVVDTSQDVDAGLAIMHNPHVMRHLPIRPPRVRARQRLLVVHHPPVDAEGAPYYDPRQVRIHSEEALGGNVLWAPVGPKVRAQFGRIDDPPPLLDWDWHDVVDVDVWAVEREHFCDRRPVMGRHSRPDRRKWPETREQLMAAYPDDPRFRVRILGGGPFLNELAGLVPRNWEILPFGAMAPEAFLATIDFFVYFHHGRWVEAFGCSIAEAMASGAVAVLPPHFRELFGDAAVYAEPEQVRTEVLRLHADWPAFQKQAEAAQELVRSRFSHLAHQNRVASLVGKPRGNGPATRCVPEPAKPRRVLFLSSNGVGMGHLTRLLAIAERCRPPLVPVFVTMSQAFAVVAERGYMAEHVPYHGHLGVDVYGWNKHLHQELNELIGFYEPAVVVCDFNSPFQGVLDAIADNPATWFVWCRRGMWRPGAGVKFIERERHFHAVLEPQDLAGTFDAGLTATSRDRTRVVAPIRLLDSDQMLPRAEAREDLGLDPERPAVIILLGAENNYDYATIRELTVRHLASRPDVQIAVAEWLMSEQPLQVPQGVIRVRRFPLSRFFRAFDAAVSAVGYNSFHELIFAGLPTLFVPNENPSQDDQLARARYAERHGLGYCVRAREIYRLKPALDRLMDPAEQALVRERCAALDARNGAAEAAILIEELSSILRADRSRTS
jgi:Glycosyltransferase family 28 C-terminal domain